ncbi:glycosyltransferase family A protein [Paucibacter sp. PLA-PC-4]|uniref:glycosyltransferase family A protein n=1 Tax=Paucibacter sp. PLA-PC-4 TaxID=2993655 RepID=UPI00224ABA56|nr:glycosyltransferase family A protein [Paucibacter sp. PLA-PC-4]MCX2865008.1 glycosyltransferase family A protein [Paucibacter sp. PLA-PC-4]
MAHPKIAVIIPFFQRKTGVLARSLASIAAQAYPSESLYVLVVDDGSPCPAVQELRDHPPAASLRITVLHQANAGPNEARNTALAGLEPDTDLVAYLDSDDEWIGDHLARAVRALNAGYSAYFANLFHLGDSTNEFDKAKRVRHEDHPSVADDPSLRAYQGDMVHQIATANIIFMPSLVIRVDALGKARFPLAHRHGGGDYLYWMDLIRHGARFVYSTEPEVRCGQGINMWYGSGWGTDGLAMRIVDEARFRRKVLEQHARTEDTKRSLRQRLAELQSGMLQDVVHRLRHRKPVRWQTVRLFYHENPLSLAALKQLFSILRAKLMGGKA